MPSNHSIAMKRSQARRFQWSFKSQTSTLLTLVIRNIVECVASAYRLNNLPTILTTKSAISLWKSRTKKNTVKQLFSCPALAKVNLGWFMTIASNSGLSFGLSPK